MATTNARIHVTAPRGDIRSQRDEDGAWFADWSAGTDADGLWLFAEWPWRALVIRPDTPGQVAIVTQLGGVRWVHHRYDYGSPRDYLIPAARWEEVQAAIPTLLAMRARHRVRRLTVDWIRGAPPCRSATDLEMGALPTLVGSPKQVDWADRIRQRLLAQALMTGDALLSRSPEPRMTAHLSRAMREIVAIRSAGWWITWQATDAARVLAALVQLHQID